MACGHFTCSRNALISLNVLYMMVAILLIGVAAYAKHIDVVSSFEIVGAVIGCGVFLFLIGCMGCIGAIKHHQICLFFYMLILFLMFLIQFSLSIALLALTTQNQHDLIAKGWAASSNETRTNIMDDINCCGLDGWKLGDLTCEGTKCCKEKFAQNSPQCGNDDSTTPTAPTPRLVCHTCMETIGKDSNKACKTVGGIGLFISLTEILGVWLSLRYRNLKDPSADPNQFL